MVICLEETALLTLGQDDKGINDFVEFRQVKDPTVESQALVPDSAHIGRLWCESICSKVNQPIGDSPSTRGRIVGCSIALSSWSMDLAQSIDGCADGGILVQGG